MMPDNVAVLPGNTSIARPLVKKKAADSFEFTEADWNMFFMMGIMMIILPSMFAKMTQPMNSYAASMSYDGVHDTRHLLIQPDVMTPVDLIYNAPHAPWVFARIENNGPNDVQVGINTTSNMFTVPAGGFKSIDKRGARDRISTLFFYCYPAQTAQLDVLGEY